MNRFPTFHSKPMLVALALTGTIGVAGAALAQQYPSTSPSSPSPATSPSNTTNAGTTRSDTTGGGMTSKSTMPSRTESADSAWQKLGSKGYVTKDDVKDLSGFSFDAADANHDGRLSQDEFRRAWSTYAGASTSGPSSSSSSSTPSTSSSSSATPSSSTSSASSPSGSTSSTSPSSDTSPPK